MPEAGLSVVVTTCLRPAALERCLAAAAPIADELLVVDAGGDRSTAAVVERHGGVLLPSPNHVMLNRTKAVGLAAATRRWILLLDDDERPDPALAANVRALADRPPRPGEPAAYRVARTNEELGRPISVDSPQLRVVRHGSARYPLRSIHEDIDVDGAVGRLDGVLVHEPDPRVAHRVHRQNLYSEHWAAHAHAEGRRASRLRLVLRPLVALAGQLTRHRRLRDGTVGYALAVQAAYTVFLHELKLWERHREGVVLPADVEVAERLPQIPPVRGPRAGGGASSRGEAAQP